MEDIVIVSAVRTAVGKFGGSLAKIPAPELGAIVIKEALAREHVYVEERSGLLRVSPHFYNTSEDLSAFAERLGRLLRR